LFRINSDGNRLEDQIQKLEEELVLSSKHHQSLVERLTKARLTSVERKRYMVINIAELNPESRASLIFPVGKAAHLHLML
jgi:CMP-2-keto-3-deoxyoctulosonic acid synthetase